MVVLSMGVEPVRCCLVFALGIALSATAVAATVMVNVDRRDGVIVIEADAVMDSDPATAWRVLTDYERYVDFMPDVKSSRVIARRGTDVTVEQTGDATFWLMRTPVAITYQIVEEPPSRLRSRARSTLLPVLESSYTLTPSGDAVRLHYEGRIGRSVEFVGPLEANEQTFTRQFRALVDRIEQAGAAAHCSRAGAS